MDVIVYDFDGTVYDGDSTIDFWKFCFKKNKLIIKFLPLQLWYWFLYKIGFKSKTEMKEGFFKFLYKINDIDKLLDDFWQCNYKKMKKWYLEKEHKDDVIISASPEFLLKNPCERLGVKCLIASKIDKITGRFSGLNCHGGEKVKRLLEKYPEVKVKEAYSDSLADLPLLKIANKAFIVNKDNILLYEE